MSVTFGFYNSLDGDRKYNASQLSSLFEGLINDGVFASIGTSLMVVANAGMTVNVGIGRAWFNRTWTDNDAELPLTLDASEILLNRIDAIVLEVASASDVRTNSIKIIKGTPASEPVVPTLTLTDGLYQYPLAYIYVGKGVTSIAQENITNKVGSSDCPLVTGILEVVNADELLVQWAAEFETWFDNLQAQMAGDVATNLQNQITQNKSGTDAHAAASAPHSGHLAANGSVPISGNQILNNAVVIQGKNSTGTARDLVKNTASNVSTFGNTSQATNILSNGTTQVNGKTIWTAENLINLARSDTVEANNSVTLGKVSQILPSGNIRDFSYYKRWNSGTFTGIDQIEKCNTNKYVVGRSEYVAVVTVNNYTASFGTAVSVGGTIKHIVYLTTDKVLICYYVSSKYYLVVGTISGTTITLGSPTAALGFGPTDIKTSSATTILITGIQYELGRCCVATISGSTITVGNLVAWDSTVMNYLTRSKICSLSDTTFLVVYFRDTSADIDYYTVGTFSGSTITAMNNPVAFLDAIDPPIVELLKLSTNQAILFCSATAYRVDVVSATATFTEITRTGLPSGVDLTYEVSSTNAIFLYSNVLYDITISSSAVSASLIELNYGQSVDSFTISSFSISPTTGEYLLGASTKGLAFTNDFGYDSIVGMALASASGGQSCQIGANGVISGLTGLIAGRPYYVDSDGTITSTKPTSGFKIGVALSTTELLINMEKF